MLDTYSISDIYDAVKHNKAVLKDMSDIEVLDFLTDLSDDGLINDSTDFTRYFVDPDNLADRLLDLAIMLRKSKSSDPRMNRILTIIKKIFEIGINQTIGVNHA